MHTVLCVTGDKRWAILGHYYGTCCFFTATDLVTLGYAAQQPLVQGS